MIREVSLCQLTTETLLQSDTSRPRWQHTELREEKIILDLLLDLL